MLWCGVVWCGVQAEAEAAASKCGLTLSSLEGDAAEVDALKEGLDRRHRQAENEAAQLADREQELARYGMLWYGVLWYAKVWCGMLCYAMLCSGMLCYAMVCCGMVWYGMLRYGMHKICGIQFGGFLVILYGCCRRFVEFARCCVISLRVLKKSRFCDMYVSSLPDMLTHCYSVVCPQNHGIGYWSAFLSTAGTVLLLVGWIPCCCLSLDYCLRFLATHRSRARFASPYRWWMVMEA